MNRLESLVEKKIREAIEEGEFDNLPGKGQPVDLRENPFEDPDLRMVHRLLRNAGFAPAWIEERKHIEAEFKIALAQLSRAWNLFGGSQTAAEHPEWQRTLGEFRQAAAELNQRIKIYNLKTPAAAFQRMLIDAERVIREVRQDKGQADESSSGRKQ